METKIVKYTWTGTWAQPKLGDYADTISFSAAVDFKIRNLDDTNEKTIHAGDIVNVKMTHSSSFPFEVNITGDLEIIVNGDYFRTHKGQFIADETNTIAEFLTNAWNNNQNVNWSVTPVTFSSTPVPAGKVFVCARVLIYMEDSTAFASDKFGGLATALTNGWQFAANGTPMFTAKDNKTLAVHMFDLTGNELFWKVNQTMIGRFSFNRFTDWADGIHIREWETIDTIVNDDLTGLDFLHVMAEGVLKDA